MNRLYTVNGEVSTVASIVVTLHNYKEVFRFLSIYGFYRNLDVLLCFYHTKLTDWILERLFIESHRRLRVKRVGLPLRIFSEPTWMTDRVCMRGLLFDSR